jgi:FkbM family methyltransferase
MKLYINYFWPDADDRTARAVMQAVQRLPSYLNHAQRFRTCIQAGGNVGVYAQWLARRFQTVITCEPDPENWACLQRNVVAPNVVAHHAAIGDAAGIVETYRPPHEKTNFGATMVRPAAMGVPVKVIDAMQLGSLDFLMLDVEGYELHSLKGAAQTIERCRPVIAVEMKGLGVMHGYTDDMLHGWLTERRYTLAESIDRDKIYTPLP